MSISIFVKHYVTPKGMEYIQKIWFPKVKTEISWIMGGNAWTWRPGSFI